MNRLQVTGNRLQSIIEFIDFELNTFDSANGVSA